MGKPGFPTCGEPVEPHPCLWGRQALPSGRVWEGAAFSNEERLFEARCGACAFDAREYNPPGTRAATLTVLLPSYVR